MDDLEIIPETEKVTVSYEELLDSISDLIDPNNTYKNPYILATAIENFIEAKLDDVQIVSTVHYDFNSKNAEHQQFWNDWHDSRRNYKFD